jgi:DNA-directed RNA polymerase subunit RPC12/RpoP
MKSKQFAAAVGCGRRCKVYRHSQNFRPTGWKRGDAMPSLAVSCPHCKARVTLDRAADLVACPHCGKGFRLRQRTASATSVASAALPPIGVSAAPPVSGGVQRRRSH